MIIAVKKVANQNPVPVVYIKKKILYHRPHTDMAKEFVFSPDLVTCPF